ncbi:MAG TPA: VanW family protein [Candidatus Atribacteria bacterium]|nr:VanW family protein [Candidatus Atribacteria bacterium]
MYRETDWTDIRKTWLGKLILLLCIVMLAGAVFAAAGCTSDPGVRERFGRENRPRGQQARDQRIRQISKAAGSNTFCEGVYLDDIALGGMTYNEAASLFKQKAEAELSRYRLEFVYQDKSWQLDHARIKAYIDWKEKLNKLYSLGRQGAPGQRYSAAESARQKNVKLSTDLKYDLDLLKEYVQAIADSLYIEPVNATIEFRPDEKVKFANLKPEKTGRRVDPDALLKAAIDRLEAIRRGDRADAIAIEPEAIEPELTVEDLSKATDLVASFSTDLLDSTENRIHNIVLSLDKINGFRLDPGQVFSFNAVVGSRSKEAGYLPAPVIMPDKSLQDDYGGGVCQTSTTLFNAAAMAGLEIVERWHHAYPVSYVPMGLDATVYYGGVDLKFRNNRDTPVFIRTYRRNNLVCVEIYGEKLPDSGEYRLETRLLSEEPAPEPKRIEDTEGRYVTEPGKSVVYVKSRPGYRVDTYRVLYQKGVKVSSELLATNYYKPVTGTIYYRPKEQP